MLRGVGQPGPISCVPAAVEASQHCSKDFLNRLMVPLSVGQTFAIATL